MLIGTTTMAFHDIDCYRARGLSDFGNKDMNVHMHVPLLPWSTAQHFISHSVLRYALPVKPYWTPYTCQKNYHHSNKHPDPTYPSLNSNRSRALLLT